MQRQLNAYHKSHAFTAKPGDLLLSLFDGALKFSSMAKCAIAAGDYEKKGLALGRALAIFDELCRALDSKRAPALCAELNALYNHYERRLHEAGLTMTTEPIDEVVASLTTFRATWSQAVHKARTLGQLV